MATTISHTHTRGLPMKPHTDSPLLSFTSANLPLFDTKHSALTTFKSFHVKLDSPVKTSITPIDDKDASLLESVPDRQPRAISSRARRSKGISPLSTQSPHRRGQIKSQSPPADDLTSSPAICAAPVTRPATAPQSSSRPKSLSRPVLTATIPAVPKVSKAAASMATAPSFTIVPIESVNRYIQDEWGPYELGKVCGPPTRGHWRPDETASCCAYPTCTVVFSLLNRRHHCRRCGDIYCKSHSLNSVPLDHEARIHVGGNRERACENCFEDYQIWKQARKSRTNSIASATASKPNLVTPVSIGAPNNGPDTPMADFPNFQVLRPLGTAPGLNPLLHGSSGSAPSASNMKPESGAYIDLNWSTF